MEHMLSDAEIDSFLASQIFGHLGCADAGKPYVIPMAFAFHANVIYGQTTEGRKTEMLRKNPFVCFQVEHQNEKEWRSVMCWGSFEELDFEKMDKADAIDITKRLSEHLGEIQNTVGVVVPFSFGEKAEALTRNNKKSTLFRILVSEKTGRSFSPDATQTPGRNP